MWSLRSTSSKLAPPDEQLALKLVLVGDLLGSLFIRQVFREAFQEGMSAGGDSTDRLTCLRQIESSPIVKRTGYKGQLPQQLKRLVALLVNPKSEIAGSFQITPDAVVAVLVPGWIRCFRADGQFRNDEEVRWILNDGKKPQGFPGSIALCNRFWRELKLNPAPSSKSRR
jgi:hypothetical protein